MNELAELCAAVENTLILLYQDTFVWIKYIHITFILSDSKHLRGMYQPPYLWASYWSGASRGAQYGWLCQINFLYVYVDHVTDFAKTSKIICGISVSYVCNNS